MNDLKKPTDPNQSCQSCSSWDNDNELDKGLSVKSFHCKKHGKYTEPSHWCSDWTKGTHKRDMAEVGRKLGWPQTQSD